MVYKTSVVYASHLILKNLSNGNYYLSCPWCKKTEAEIDQELPKMFQLRSGGAGIQPKIV